MVFAARLFPMICVIPPRFQSLVGVYGFCGVSAKKYYLSVDAVSIPSRGLWFLRLAGLTRQ